MSSSALTTAPRPDADERTARRLAPLLSERRRQSGLRLRAVARASQGSFTPRELRRIESGALPLDLGRATEVARLYGIDVAVVGANRLPLDIDPRGVISTGGSAISFDPGDADSLLTNYLRLVRAMRREDRPHSIQLRRQDVDVLALYLELPGESVVERLAELMGATQLQRRVLAGMFVAGSMVIGLSARAAANLQREKPGDPTDLDPTSAEPLG